MPSEANAHKSTDPLELWKDWNETITRMWPGLLAYEKEAFRVSFGLYNFWMKSAGVAQRQLKASPIDPAEVWKQWTDVIFDLWRTATETSTSAVGTFYRVNEELFQNLQLPTRSVVTRLEEFVASLEERVYTIEDALMHLEDGYLKVATDQVGEPLAEHLERVDDKRDVLSSSTLQRTEMLGDLAGRLERVDDKLNILLAALKKIEARACPEATDSRDDSEAREA